MLLLRRHVSASLLSVNTQISFFVFCFLLSIILCKSMSVDWQTIDINDQAEDIAMHVGMVGEGDRAFPNNKWVGDGRKHFDMCPTNWVDVG